MDRIWVTTMLATLAKGLRKGDGDAEDLALAGILDDVTWAIKAERVPDLAAAVTEWTARVADELERDA